MSRQKMMTLSVLAMLCAMVSLGMQAKAAEQDGMVAVRDPQTGKLRAPTPQELRELRAKAPPTAAAVAGVPRENLPLARRDGARGVRLGEKSLVYEVVTRNADGTLSSRCVHGDASLAPAADHHGGRHEAR